MQRVKADALTRPWELGEFHFQQRAIFCLSLGRFTRPTCSVSLWTDASSLSPCSCSPTAVPCIPKTSHSITPSSPAGHPQPRKPSTPPTASQPCKQRTQPALNPFPTSRGPTPPKASTPRQHRPPQQTLLACSSALPSPRRRSTCSTSSPWLPPLLQSQPPFTAYSHVRLPPPRPHLLWHPSAAPPGQAGQHRLGTQALCP